jgi:hypothetical protein
MKSSTAGRPLHRRVGPVRDLQLTPFGVRVYAQHLPPARVLELIARRAEEENPAS